MPLWMFLLGRFFVDISEVIIPYMEIAKCLLLVIIPCLLGMLVNHFRPSVGRIVLKIIPMFSSGFILFQLVASAWVNSYMYSVAIREPVVFAAGLLLPWCGFLCGYLIGKLCRQSKTRCITIALETGIQNVGIPMVMLIYAFPQPEGDIGAVLPMISAYLNVLVLYTVYGIILISRRLIRKKDEDKDVSITDSAPIEGTDIKS